MNTPLKMLSRAAFAVMATLSSAYAADGIWTVDANGLWSTTDNWSGGTIADGSTFTASFTNNITVDRIVSLDSARTLNKLVFSDSVTATPGSWLIDNNATPANTLTLAGTTPSITVNSLGTGKTAEISAVMAGSTAWTKLGVGTLVLSGTNNFTGTTTITGGDSTTAKLLVSGTGALTGGGALQVGSGTIAGRFEYTSSATNTVFSTITLGSGANGGRATLVQSNGTITATTLRTAPGRTGGNTGNINISGGTLRVTGTATIGEQDLAVTPSTVTISDSGLFQVDNGLKVGIAQTDTRDGNGIITQNGGTVTVAGGLTLAGTASSTWTRTAIYNLNGGTLNVNAITMATTGAGSNSSTFNFAGGTLKPTASSATFMQGLTWAYVKNGGAKIDTNGKDITIAQALVKFAGATTDTLTKSGNGTLTLSGTNTYGGTTTVSGGTLALGATNALPAAGAVSLAGSTLDIGGLSAAVAGSLSGSGTLAVSTTGTLALSGTLTADLAIQIKDPLNLRRDTVYTLATCSGTPSGIYTLVDLPFPWVVHARSGALVLRVQTGTRLILF